MSNLEKEKEKMIEIHVPVCFVDKVYNGEKLDYISVNTPDGDKLKFSVEKNKLNGTLDWGNKVSIKSKAQLRLYKNGLSIRLIDPQVNKVE